MKAKNILDEVGARSYKNTGRSNAACCGRVWKIPPFYVFPRWDPLLSNWTSIWQMGSVFDRDLYLPDGIHFAEWDQYLANGKSI